MVMTLEVVSAAMSTFTGVYTEPFEKAFCGTDIWPNHLSGMKGRVLP